MSADLTTSTEPITSSFWIECAPPQLWALVASFIVFAVTGAKCRVITCSIPSQGDNADGVQSLAPPEF